LSQTQREPLMEHVLRIPDELLDWGREAVRAVRFASPWAHDIDALMQRAADRPLNTRETEALLSRLEALCAEAIRAGRGELLRGFDLLTAEWLGLSYSFETSDGRVEFGRHAAWSYSELRVILAAEDPRQALAAAQQVKGLVAEVFPHARVSAIIDSEETAACFSCGSRDVATMIALSTGSCYCGPCYRAMMRRAPKIEKTKKAKGGGRR